MKRRPWIKRVVLGLLVVLALLVWGWLPYFLAGQVTGGTDVTTVPPDWRVRFGAAYHAELQAWITGLIRGEIVGPSAWDGYAATRVTELGVQAVQSGERVAIDYIAKPDLYA